VAVETLELTPKSFYSYLRSGIAPRLTLGDYRYFVPNYLFRCLTEDPGPEHIMACLAEIKRMFTDILRKCTLLQKVRAGGVLC
jgi:hypothetical protein